MGNPASTDRAEPPPASARANTDPRRGRMVALGAMVAASALIAATTLIAKALDGGLIREHEAFLAARQPLSA